MSPTDNNTQINNYKAQYGITNPCAGTQGNGPAAIDITIDGQNFIGYPTYCVVCPDHTLYFDVCWPPTEQCFYPYFEMCAPAIAANFTSDIQDVCQFGNVQFDDLSMGSITSWLWTFEGGTPATSTSQNPLVTYNTVGVFDVTLTVTGSSGSDTYTASDYIQVFALPVVTLAPFTPVPVNAPAFALTGGLPSGGNYSGPGVSNNIFYPAVAGLGTHTITYTFMDGNGCSDEAQQNIVVTPEGGEYCVPGANCSYGDGFTDFAFAGIENYESGCSPGGYGDFTDMTGTVEIGYVFTAQMQTGYDDQFVSMWIDFNDNFEFETWERIVTDFSLTTAGVMTPLDILIPGNSLPGTHRMRIGSNWQANSSPDPCATFNYGEWEDYTLVVSGTSIATDALVFSIDMNSTIQTGDILPKATVKNNGTQTISFPVVCTVPSAGYTSTVQVTDLGLGQQIQVTFDTWAAAGGIYTLEVCTQLTGDELSGNDCMSKEIAVLNYDVGVLAVNMGAIVMLGDITPKATVKNFGFETVTFPVTMTSTDAGYSSTVEVANLAPGEQLIVSFDTWSNSLGQFTFEACSELTLDENPNNNCSEMLVTVSEDARQKVVMEIATGTW